MLDDFSQERMILMVTSLLFVIVLFKYLGAVKKSKKLTLEIKRREDLLGQTTADKIIAQIKLEATDISAKLENGKSSYNELLKLLNESNIKIKHIDVGLYPPVFKYDDEQLLQKNIISILSTEYEVISSGGSTRALSDWSWFGSKSKGQQMVKAYEGLILRAFNAEFEFIRKQMRYSTFASAVTKLYKLEEQLGKLGETTNVTVSSRYVDIKKAELETWHHGLCHKEEIKQRIKEQKALLKEQNKSSGGIDIADIEDDIYYKKSDLKKAQEIALKLHGGSALEMERKIQKMKLEVDTLEKKFERSVSQAQLTKAGYVYVISNIGSFGKGVVKIGMTRRLEPMDRVNELGDASVPFKFDVHTLAFVKNAPEIENALHKKFSHLRVNEENMRKEFFKVSPQEVEKVFEELEVESDWYYEIEAKEFRESLLIRESANKSFEEKSVAKHLPSSI